MSVVKNAKFILAAIKRRPVTALLTAVATSAYCYVAYYQAKNMQQIIEDWRSYNYQFSSYADAPDSFVKKEDFCPAYNFLENILPVCPASDDPTAILQHSLNKGQYAIYKYYAIMNAKPLLAQFIDQGLTNIFISYVNFKWLGSGVHAELGVKYVPQAPKIDIMNITTYTAGYAKGIREMLLLAINCINTGVAVYQFYQQRQQWHNDGFDITKYAFIAGAAFMTVNLVFNYIEGQLSKKEIFLKAKQSSMLVFNVQNSLQVEVSQATAMEHSQLEYNIYRRLVNNLLSACSSIARSVTNVVFQEVTYMNMLYYSIPTIVMHPHLFKTMRQLTDQMGLALDELSAVVNVLVDLSAAKQAAKQVLLFDECTTNYKLLLQKRQLSISRSNEDIVCDFSVCYPGRDQLFHIQYEFKRGNIYALSGDSGAGKSSFFNSLIGVNPYCIGKINAPAQENFIYISQSIALKPELNFVDTLLYPQKYDDFADNKKAVIDELIMKLAQAFGMSSKMLHDKGNWIDNLSGGEVQRLAIMQAIVKMVTKSENGEKHIVLLIDEGLNALNPQMRGLVFNTLCKYVKECNATCIAIDHGDEKELQHMYGEKCIIDFNKFSTKGSGLKLS